MSQFSGLHLLLTYQCPFECDHCFVWETPLAEMLSSYDGSRHPICGPLLAGGPAELARAFEVPHAETYVDECHMCYEMRRALRRRAPHLLGPDQMYGVPGR